MAIHFFFSGIINGVRFILIDLSSVVIRSIIWSMKGIPYVFDNLLITRPPNELWYPMHIYTEAYKGHCVLCKDVLCFVFQTFDFQVLCFGFCVLCPVLLNGAMET